MTVQTQTVYTAEEYMNLPDDGRFRELVKGVIVDMPPPQPDHGYICASIVLVLGSYVREKELGRVVSNDSGVVTERGPDTVRGMDVAYYSYDRVPRGPRPPGYWPTPELIFEVMSPSDRVSKLSAKAGEYLDAGAVVVCIVDPETECVAVFTQNELPRRLSNGDELTLPELFPDFRAPVRQFFA